MVVVPNHMRNGRRVATNGSSDRRASAKRTWHVPAMRSAVIALGILACGLLGFDFWRFASGLATRDMTSGPVPRADGIVVLTGGAQRVPDAIALLLNGHGQRLLISGVYEKSSKEEIARAAGVSAAALECCVDLDKRARNTIGNAIQTRRWAEAHGFRSLVVVTSNYHLPRTLEEFRHTLRNVTIHGVPVVADPTASGRLWSDMGLARLAFLEYAKLVVARLRHLVEEDPEFSRLPVMVGRQKPLAQGRIPDEVPAVMPSAR